MKKAKSFLSIVLSLLLFCMVCACNAQNSDPSGITSSLSQGNDETLSSAEVSDAELPNVELSNSEVIENLEKYTYQRESLTPEIESTGLGYGFDYDFYDGSLYFLERENMVKDGMTYQKGVRITAYDLKNKSTSTVFEAGENDGSIFNFAFDQAGKLWVAVAEETGDKLHEVKDGVIRQSIDLGYEIDEDPTYQSESAFYVDPSGQFYLAFTSIQKLFLCGSDGAVQGEISIENGLPKSIVSLSEEPYLVFVWEDFSISKIDRESKTLGDPQSVAPQPLSALCAADAIGMKYCFYNETGVYATDGGENTVCLFSWTDHGFESSYPSRIFMTENGDILCCSWNELTFMKRIPKEEGENRIQLKLAAFRPGEALRSVVAKFNRASSEYMVKLVDYDVYNTESEPYAGLIKLNTEIIGGNPPDLIDLREIDARRYMKLGIMEDLYPYLDQDPELNREDFLENVLTAMGDGEALYGVTSTFRVDTMAAKTSVDFPWNYDGLQKALQENPKAVLGASKTKFLKLVCTYMGSHFVDWDSGKASFDSPAFLSLLETCNALPETAEVSDIYVMMFVDPDYPAYYAPVSVSDFQSASEYEGAFGEPISYVGYPESGNTISLRMFLGMTSAGQHKDGAWDFLRSLLLPEIQTQNEEFTMGFPISKTAFESAVQGALHPSGSWQTINAETGEAIEDPAPSQEQVDKVIELCKSTSVLSSNDTMITDIVLEEAASYFSGSKSAKDAAAIIQNRVSIYMNEQSLLS